MSFEFFAKILVMYSKAEYFGIKSWSTSAHKNVSLCKIQTRCKASQPYKVIKAMLKFYIYSKRLIYIVHKQDVYFCQTLLLVSVLNCWCAPA